MVTAALDQKCYFKWNWKSLFKAFQQFQEKNLNEIKTRLAELSKQKERIDKNLYCRFCRNRITSTNQSIQMNGSVDHQFTNPEGNSFEIACFSVAPGCVQTGTPTIEHTWFDNYAWRFALCAKCHLHMGWFYQSSQHNFYGLIRNALIHNS
jgi:hypothetical protein